MPRPQPPSFVDFHTLMHVDSSIPHKKFAMVWMEESTWIDQYYVCRCVAGERPGGRELTAHDTHHGGHPSSGVRCTTLETALYLSMQLLVTCSGGSKPTVLSDYYNRSAVEGDLLMDMSAGTSAVSTMRLTWEARICGCFTRASGRSPSPWFVAEPLAQHAVDCSPQWTIQAA